MKPLKYTAAALALIAVASFSQSAMAQTTGDLVFGVYDKNSTSINNYELDLGAIGTLSNGETWDLGSTVTSQFSSDSSSNLIFDIAATGGAGGTPPLAADELAFTLGAIPGTTLTSNTSGANTDITALTTDWTNVKNSSGGGTIALPSSTSSNGTAIEAIQGSTSTTGSFFNELITHTAYGFGSGDEGDFGASFAPSTVSLYTDTDFGGGVLTPDGTFTITDVAGDEVLTYNLAATPEPSAYALGLCAVALFWVLKRRSSVA